MSSNERVPSVRMFVCLHKDSNFPVAAVVRSARSLRSERKTRLNRTRLIPPRERARTRAPYYFVYGEHRFLISR